ncbi:hypothetical protein BLNAU_6194 [Blattamonas nauphoetae]|uniref:Uncharacterized protein n=1 Tax=Blattamonas nauphoetae TaxID=2049346 RepID=A0ABQ9Y5B9_9EUKA|nr:hypothetical protein BLNAU_6194 [Blattamonas nauphoetae]
MPAYRRIVLSRHIVSVTPISNASPCSLQAFNGLTLYWLFLRPFVLPIDCQIHPLLKSHLYSEEQTSHFTAHITIVTSIQFRTETKSEGNSSSDIISTLKLISTPSFPQFNATISSSTLKDDYLILRKKLTPTSNTTGPRLELNNNQKTDTLLTSFQAPLSQFFLLSHDFFHTFSPSGNSLNVHDILTALESAADIDVAAMLMDRKLVLSALLSTNTSIVSKDYVLRRFTIERLLPMSSTLPFPSIPIKLLFYALLMCMSHSDLAKTECLLRLELLSQLVDIARSVNPEHVRCAT